VSIVATVSAPSQISLSFPARPEFLRLARLASADAGARAGLNYEEIDDLRIAVSELCSLVAGDPDALLTLEFAFDDDEVRVTGSATPGRLVDNEFSRAIVDAVVDDVEVTTNDGSCTFLARKRHALN
jgi:serine/threonine-protein kinase RsbW